MSYSVYAEMAAKYAHEKLTRGSSNWKDLKWQKKEKGGIDPRNQSKRLPSPDNVTMRMVNEIHKHQLDFRKDEQRSLDIEGLRAGSVSFSGDPKVWDVAHALRVAAEATFLGAGNCGEFSAVAFSYLYKRDILPLDLMSSTCFDHAWVVIGRPAGTDETDPTSWIDEDDPLELEPVICDPWLAKGKLRYTPRDYHEMVVDIEDYVKYYVPKEVKLILRAEKKTASRKEIKMGRSGKEIRAGSRDDSQIRFNRI